LALIEIDGVTKTYALENNRALTAIDHIDLSVADGEFVSIIGPSGCGKSTLLHMIGGFVPCSAGEIRVRGTVIRSPGPDRGIVFQHFALFPWKTVLGNVEYGLAERGIGKAERRSSAQAFIDMVKLTGFENTYPNRLSGGMQQRVAIARTLACEPSILLHEPKNRDRALKIMSELTNRPPADFADWALLPGKDYYHDPHGLVNEKALQSNVESLAELKMIPKSFDVRPHIDNSLVQDASKNM